MTKSLKRNDVCSFKSLNEGQLGKLYFLGKCSYYFYNLGNTSASGVFREMVCNPCHDTEFQCLKDRQLQLSEKL